MAYCHTYSLLSITRYEENVKVNITLGMDMLHLDKEQAIPKSCISFSNVPQNTN